MSDPVSTMDVEDVLSSIRRLVSEEAKGNTGKPGSGHPADADAEDIFEAAETAASDAIEDAARQLGIDAVDYENASPPSNETNGAPVAFRHTPSAGRARDDQKLVLTAAFRVPEADDQPDADDDFEVPAYQPTGLRKSPEADSAPARPDRPHLRSIDTSREADITPVRERAATRPNPFDYAPEDTLFDRARRAMETVRPGRPARVPANAAPPRTVRQPVSEVDASSISDDPETTATYSEAFAAAGLGRSADTTGDTGLLAGEIARTKAWPDDDAGAENPAKIEAEFDTGTDDNTEDGAEDISMRPMPDRASVSSPFNASGGMFAHGIEPDQDEPEAAVPEAFASPVDDEPSTINFTEDEDPFLDEETLRDMVSEMVRQELQGELGDRITRNVRKLVRREIQRALATREFE